MNIAEIIALALGGIQAAGTSEQIAAIVNWLSLAIKGWQLYDETAAELVAIADRTQVLNDGGWKLAEVEAEYARAEAKLKADFDALHGDPA